MPKLSSMRPEIQHPFTILTTIFVLWKAALILIVVASPAPGYDTSTTLLDWQGGHSLLAKFVRWDAIYFTQIAQHGHVFEQEWAWGIGYSSILRWTTRVLFATDEPLLWHITVSGLLIAHFSSFISMLLIWSIAAHLAPGEPQARATVAFVAALLYIISPAGVFLSAPYTESPFAAMNMLGMYLFLLGNDHFRQRKHTAAALTTLLGGLTSGIATVVRSNGILNGMPFAWEAVSCLLPILQGRVGSVQVVRLLSLGLGGFLIALGMILPQYQAYLEYCIGPSSEAIRPWCHDRLPSIFTFVQSHYWNVGIFRYWTLSNLPLFLLATPTLAVLLWSGHDCLFSSNVRHKSIARSQHLDAIYIAAPQLVLATLAVTSYHVQIITRISSGYPYWYLWLSLVNSLGAYRPQMLKGVVTWMVLYAAIQAGLYASFLPPA